MSISIDELVSRKTSEEFPNILITKPNDTLPVVVRSLEKGDVQLIVEFNGKRKVVDRISPSAYNVDKLIRTVGEILYNKSQNVTEPISDIVTYLNCVV